MNIALSGVPGSGKSALAKAIASRGWETISAGSAMRQHSTASGASIADMQEHGEDMGIDRLIDRAVAEVPATSTTRCLIDARMGWALSPRCLSVLVRCEAKAASQRVFAVERGDEACASTGDATAEPLRRGGHELDRYERLYGMSYEDDVYDLVVDTGTTSPEEAADRIVRAALTLEDECQSGVIGRFRGNHFFLSNMFETQIEFDGLAFTCSESAYQAQKFADPSVREQMARMDGKAAKRFAATMEWRDGWLQTRRQVMERVVMAKFSQSEELRRRLVHETEGFWLEEGNDWGDTYFGVVTSDVTGLPFGANVLGRTLMKVRRELSGLPRLGA